MAKLVPKLNLNKVPQSVENNSLVFAKNIKLLPDNTITKDDSIDVIKRYEKYEEKTTGNKKGLLGHIVGINNKVYFFIAIPKTTHIDENTNETIVDEFSYTIEEYDELTRTIKTIESAWTYNGGKITGCVTVNNTNEPILTIAEYFDDEDLNNSNNVPIKHINLFKCSSQDDESVYTQHPKLPITNLTLIDYYNTPIPAGVYQFFIRYKIRENFYTTWMPCSTELFAINQNKIKTIQGSILYNDIRKESNKSFIFNAEHLIPDNLSIYEEFQLGFICSRDNGVFARSWKHFKINSFETSTKIIFDFNEQDVEDINIDDLIIGNYELFNVKNIASYRNKLYISNYKETNFNNYNVCNNFATGIKIDINKKVLIIDAQTTINNIPIKKDTGSRYYNKTLNSNNEWVDLVPNINPKDFCTFINVGSGVSEDRLVILPDNKHKLFINNYEIVTNVGPKRIAGRTELTHGDTTYGYATPYINQYIKETLWDNVVGLNDTGSWIINIDNTFLLLKGIRAFIEDYTAGGSSYGVYDYKFDFTPKYPIVNRDTDTDNIIKDDYQTLMPYTDYDFYCHFVKENGIITNGFYIGSKNIKRYADYVCITQGNYYGKSINDINEVLYSDADAQIPVSKPNVLEDYSDNILSSYYYIPITPGESTSPIKLDFEYRELDLNTILYPSFTPTTNIPSDYIGYFISIYKHNNNVTQGFNYYQDPTSHAIEFDSIEYDVSLYNGLDNITIKGFDGTILSTKGIYESSGSTNNNAILGSLGHIKFDYNESYNGNTIWTIVNENLSTNIDKILIKVTPFIKQNNSYNNYKDLNLLGHLCLVNKLTKEDYYVSGTDVYDKGDDLSTITINKNKLNLFETLNSIIHSNYNLHCVSLSQDINYKFREYEVIENDTTINKTQVIYSVDSLIASYILEYQSTFKDYTRRTYNEYNPNNLTIFNNTVRASNVDVDETYRNIYRFEPTDYYNVPTNRGSIVYMFAILNNIYIHTEHSLFKFTTNTKLNTNEGEASLTEATPFDAGIQEVFDSQYGYGGLQKREHSLITYNAYIFYDKLVNTIYAYDTHNLTPISNPIKKVLEYINPTDVIFASDTNNDRFYINIKNEETNVCLTFNTVIGSFISIHDLDFNESFNTRSHPYFIKYDDTHDIVASLNENDNTTNYYDFKTLSALRCNDVDNINTNNTKVGNCIDVVCNVEYEKIKVLNYINWICKAVSSYNNTTDFNLAEEIGEKYSGYLLRIYTDQTHTPLISLTNGNNEPLIANNEEIKASKSWQYPRFNCGVWSLNYFRDIKNIEDIFDYGTHLEGSDIADLTPYLRRENLTQDSSLIYGKYFVLRIIFKDKKFKLENIIFKMNDYGKA